MAARIRLKTLLFITCLLAFSYAARAQSQYDRISGKIDSLANAGLPKSALMQIEKLDSLARRNNNAPQQIKATVYRMTFQSYLQEDALAAIISRLKADIDRAGYPVKPVLQSLLAQMYWNYYQQNRYQFAQRSTLSKPDSDFTNWDLRTIISETGRLYRQSLAEATKEGATPISVLDGVLAGDSSTRYLRPALYDLLAQRALDFFLSGEAGLNQPKLTFSLNDERFFADASSFASLAIKTTDTASAAYQGIKLLQQATAFHISDNNHEALANLDMQRLKFLQMQSNAVNRDSLYVHAMRQLAQSFVSKPISADAWVQLGQYYQQTDSLRQAYGCFQKAASSYPESLGGRNGLTLMRQVGEKTLSVNIEETNAAGRPVLALLSYKNLEAAKIRVYRLSEGQLQQFTYQTDPAMSQNQYKRNFLKKLSPMQIQSVSWSGTSDFRQHSLEFKIESLTPGNYVLLAGDTTGGDSLESYTSFRVSNMAYTSRMNPDDQVELRLMNRQTGAPLHGVQIHLSGHNSKYNSDTKKYESLDINADGVSDRNGFFKTDKFSSGYGLSVRLVMNGDTLADPYIYANGARYDSDDDDDPADKTILFSDRQIYRPGQTIYFKALQLQVLKGKSKLMPQKYVDVKFFNTNNQLVTSLNLLTNEFGSVSGSFVVPQSMPGGEISLKTNDGSLSLQVEEYKRPTFQVQFSPVTESYKLNDSVTLKGNVTAFSGYGISQAKVAYHIVRRENVQVYHYNAKRVGYSPVYNQAETEIAGDTITSDDQGQFKIKFKAVAPDFVTDSGIDYNYTVSADVTDGSGETRSGEITATVGNNDIRIDTYLPAQLIANDSLSAPVKIGNLNGQAQKGKIKVEVYLLKDPGRMFKNRLWQSPDQYVIGEQEFRTDFPGYAYRGEDNVSGWVQLNKVMSQDIDLDGTQTGLIDFRLLTKQPSGQYRVIVSARNAKGDTTSITGSVNLVNQPSKPLKFDDWVIPLTAEVKAGDTARFLVGTDQHAHVLMERYNGPKLISSQWLNLQPGQQNVGIPVSTGDKNVAVQFMMVYQNRVYNSYQKISIYNPGQNLKIKLITFHNKLQPGQKEQWKLQVSGPQNEKQAAEMVADLYDASLDDITPAQTWQNALNDDYSNSPNFFVWNTWNFVRQVNSFPFIYLQDNYTLRYRDYEHLNLFGYNYFGGYNDAYQQYLRRTQLAVAGKRANDEMEQGYARSVAKFKNGIDISGKLIGADDKQEIVGATVSIKGTNITVVTNASGYFKIRAPKNGTLVFSYIGYNRLEIPAAKAGATISLTPTSSALQEVVVTGYGTKLKKDVTASEANFKAPGPGYFDKNQSLQGKAAGLSVEDNAPNSTRIVLRGNSSLPAEIITPRTNFNETAFFYPQLHTDEKGQILIDFTIPEALTRWKFRGFAHTRDLKTGYVQAEVITQKQLSISANAPRFLREGDTITISARLANLTAGKLKGKVQLQLFNAVNMQPVNLFLSKADSMQDFTVDANTNKAVSFRLAIPAGLDALDYKLTADAGNFVDGEENTLPVLTNRMLVTESMPMMVRAGQTKDFTFDKLVNQHSNTLKNKTLTLEYTGNPAWYAVQALPYMMEYPYECSEQVFSRYFANSLAMEIVNKNPVIKRTFEQWKNANSTELLSNLEKNQELKATLIEETPWLQDAQNETEQKKRIALLFDLNKMSDELKLTLDKLQKRQLPNGGFTWFGGDLADRFITQHILAGAGELHHLHIGDDDAGLQTMTAKALEYMDNQLLEGEKQRQRQKNDEWLYGDLEIHAWFARSYFASYPMNKAVKTAFENYLKWAGTNWVTRSAYEQAMIALTMERCNKQDVTAKIERSLLETAQTSDELGMYWAKNRLGYYWYESPIEAQSLLIELFTESGDNAKAVDEMKIWLLRNKQTNDWKTTKATAAACYALLLKGSDLLTDTAATSISLGGKPLQELKPDVKADAGTGYLKTTWQDEQVKPELGKVEITNNGKTVSWGALHWQYLENLDKVTSANTNIRLRRKYFIQKQTDAGAVLTEVDAAHQPKVGDLLKVVVYLDADREFEYVQLKDMRPAGTEPVDALSDYKYQDGLYYYQVTKDVATNFFISQLPKGNFVFEYRLRVAQPGNFSTGITSIQCMYAPEFNAHSEGGRMVVKP